MCFARDIIAEMFLMINRAMTADWINTETKMKMKAFEIDIYSTLSIIDLSIDFPLFCRRQFNTIRVNEEDDDQSVIDQSWDEWKVNRR